MAYIYLDELKEILPDIFNQWVKNDEDWEWILQEIEQKCHIGKKGKKKKKFDKEEYIRRNRVDIDALIQKFQALNKEVEEMHRNQVESTKSMTMLAHEISDIKNDVSAAKSMAQTAKQRTEVDYTKCSKEKSDEDVVQEVYNRMIGRGATLEELEFFRNIIKKYDALEKKEIPVTKKTCETCRYDNGKLTFANQPCKSCNLNDKWEASNG